MNAVFLYSTQTVSTSKASELLYFLKNCATRNISLFYTFGELLAKSLKTTHLNLLLIAEKTFQWTWLVEPRLWSSFTIHWIILCKSIHILVYLFFQGKRNWICFDACIFMRIQRWGRSVDILTRVGNCGKKSTDKKKTYWFRHLITTDVYLSVSSK